MRISMWSTVASLTFLVPACAFAQQVASRSPRTVEQPKAEVLRAGTGSFATYLSQSAGTPVAPVAPSFVLRKGELVHIQLQAWAQAAGWELLWQPDISWKVLGDTNFSSFTDVTLAVTEVINILRDEGRPVGLNIADGNRIMEVISTDVVSNREVNGD